MLTLDEILRVIAAPALVAVIVAAVGRWKRWPWTMPLAVSAGFLTGYALMGVPRLPPRDGTDWLFWLTIPLAALAILDAIYQRWWGCLLGAAAGPAAALILHPLVPAVVPWGVLAVMVLLLAAVGAALCLALRIIEPHVGAPILLAGLCITLAGAAVVIFSSNLRIVGIYGLAAAAALAATAVIVGPTTAARSISILAIGLLAALLTGGRFYPEPGVPWSAFLILLASPALLLAGLAIPPRRTWLRSAVSLSALALAVAAVALPSALSARRAAEADPYGYYD